MKIISLISFILLSSVALAVEPDGIPNVVPNSFTPVNVCYTADSGEVIHEIFNSPNVSLDKGPVSMLLLSPIDAARSFMRIPSFGLAKWHWWVVSQGIFRAQREYTDCVGAIREHNIILKEMKFDAPNSPFTPGIDSIREYEVPFEAIQNTFNPTTPPRKEDAIQHLIAAIATFNSGVAHVQACKSYLDSKKVLTQKKIKKYESDIKSLKRRLAAAQR